MNCTWYNSDIESYNLLKYLLFNVYIYIWGGDNEHGSSLRDILQIQNNTMCIIICYTIIVII